MLFAMMAIDKPGMDEKRAALHAQHVAHLKSAQDYGVSIVAGGPLVSDDGATSIGSLMLLEAAERAAVERFNKADPFNVNGIWSTVEIRRFDRKE